MLMRRHFLPCLAILALSVLAWSDPPANPQKPALSSKPMSKETRMLVIRSLNAEIVFVRHVLPQGEKGVRIKDGQVVSPTDKEMEQLLANWGPAAKPGDRAQITNIAIKDNRIILEINGGPKKKSKWYQHVQVGVAGGVAQAPDDSGKNPHGSLVELEFATKFVPEMTGEQVRELFYPVLDFRAHSAAEAYLESVPPKVKEAIKNHAVLVGMNHEMVIYAKGRPDKKIRERDDEGKDYEEWLYGQPPQEVQFVRFQGDEVVRLEIMKINGDKIVRTEKEVDVVQTVAEKKPEQPKTAAPTQRPTLRRPGDEPDPRAPAPASATQPGDPPMLPPEPSASPLPSPGGPGTN
jgi:hypothetical protein